MKPRKLSLPTVALLALSVAGLAPSVPAQVFQYNDADLCLGFRKNPQYGGNYQVIADLGQVSTYENLSIGTTVNVSAYCSYTGSLLSGCFAGLNNLFWSVTGEYANLNTPYPIKTIWVTAPRSTLNVQTAPPTRLATRLQQDAALDQESMMNDAMNLSGPQPSPTNAVDFISESSSPPAYEPYGYYIEGTAAPGYYSSTLRDTWTQNVENTTPGSFTTAVQSDLYEVQPLTSASGKPIVDPHVGTNSTAYYLGYFQFNPDGSMTFTRQAAVAPLPPAPTLSINVASTTITISFASTNGSTYTLYATNAAGLATPVIQWPTLGSLTGNGASRQFQDTIASSNRFYAVIVH
jgi:hypothetical protein